MVIYKDINFIWMMFNTYGLFYWLIKRWNLRIQWNSLTGFKFHFNLVWSFALILESLILNESGRTCTLMYQTGTNDDKWSETYESHFLWTASHLMVSSTTNGVGCRCVQVRGSARGRVAPGESDAASNHGASQAMTGACWLLGSLCRSRENCHRWGEMSVCL